MVYLTVYLESKNEVYYIAYEYYQTKQFFINIIN